LFSRAAQLHQVNLELPEKVIGRNTAASIQSGLFHGHAAMITALLDRIREELLATSSSEPKIIATGGLITRLIPVLPKLIHRDDLTLHGLSRIHLRNVKSPKAD
jgi:type III pantothenate kinase